MPTMSTRINPDTLNESDREILTFLLPHQYVGQERITDHLTQTFGHVFDANRRPPMETLEKLANTGLIERNPKAGRQWGLSLEGEAAAKHLAGEKPAPIRKATRQVQAAAEPAEVAQVDTTVVPRARYGKKRDRAAESPDAE